MSQVDALQLEAAIKCYQDPYLNEDLYALKAIQNVACDEQGEVLVDIRMGYPCEGIKGAMIQLLTSAIENVAGVESVTINVTTEVIPHQVQSHMKNMDQVKNIIAVASGKGGVGKSTTAVNLALALSQEGAKVGVLDADIYGPSIGVMLGFPDGTQPKTHENQFFIPLEKYGLQAMSMAFLVTDNTPMVWRGPMVSGAMQQLLNQSLWDDLDYLIIDMPPGTGDIQLTLSQKVPVAGSVIVTTPQDIALLDCKKGIEMFRKVDIPVLGIIENMSVHICSRCGHHEQLFGEGGGERIADKYETLLLGQLPLHLTIREQADSGTPTVVAEPDSEVALMYRDIARKVAAELSQRARNYSNLFPEIIVSQD